MGMRRSRVCFVAAFVIAGCHAGTEVDEPVALERVSPASVSAPAAWPLFDRDVESGFLPTGDVVAVALTGQQQLSAIRFFGSAPYRLRVTGRAETSLGFTTIDLSSAGAGWHTVPSTALVATDSVELTFEALGTPEKIPEIELWSVAREPSQTKRDPAAAELADGLVSIAPESTSAELLPGDCSSFTFELARSPSQFTSTYLVYDADGAFREFVLRRSTNGLPDRGGAWIAGDGSTRTLVDQIDPETLQLGGNELRLCVPSNAPRGVALSHVRLVGDLDRGVGLVASATVAENGADVVALHDESVEQTVEVGAAGHVALSFQRLIAPSTLTLAGNNLDAANVDAVQCVLADGQREPIAIGRRWLAARLMIELEGGTQRCAGLDVVFKARASIAEIDVAGSGAGERTDWPHVVVTSAPEHFGDRAWVGGFVARPPRMTGAIRVAIADRAADAMAGEFGALLARSGDVMSAWPVGLRAALPDGTSQIKDIVLDRDMSAQLRATTGSAAGGTGASSNIDKAYGREDESVVVRAKRLEAAIIRLGTKVGVDVPVGAVDRPTDITVRHLTNAALPPLDPGMINVTAPSGRGYEFLPHGQRFARAVEVVVPYDPASLPEGMKPDDVHTYFFDPVAKRWKPLPRKAIDVGERVARSTTDHFTIMIDAVLVVPKNASPLSFDPTTMSSIGAASPSANVALIEPPVPNSTGDARVAYPLWIPSARGNYQPAVSITYGSSSGNSWLGIGWDLQLSRVEVDMRWGVPRYDGRERYLLDGAELVPTADTDGPTCDDGTPGTRFHTRIEGAFAHILRCGDAPTNYYWLVHDRSGTRFLYGTAEASLSTPAGSHGASGIARWHLAKVTDVNGNESSFEYTRDELTQSPGEPNVEPSVELYPKRITYTKHPSKTTRLYSIEFQLDNGRRPDRIISGLAGFKTLTRHLLRSVQVRFGTVPVRTYALTYESGDFGKTLLSKITVFGAGDCDPNGAATTPPTCAAQSFVEHTFEYHKEATTAAFGATEPWNVSGETDSPEDGTLARGRTITGSASEGVSASVLASRSVDGSLGDRNEQIGTYDVNGDGLPDLVEDTDSGIRVFYNNPDQRTQVLFAAANPAVSGLSALGDDDLYSVGTSASAVLLNGSYHSSVTRSGRFFTDLDGDGFIDILDVGGTTLFGHPCPLGQGHCFTEDSNRAGLVPVGLIDPREDSQLDQIASDHDARTIMGDPIVRWVAPYSGTIDVRATARRLRGGTTDGASVGLWKQDTFLAGTGLGATNTTAVTFTEDPLELDITAGEALYLRVTTNSDDGVANDGTLQDEVDARLHVEYLETCLGGTCTPTTGLRTSAHEPTGEPVFVFDSHDDFRIAGRPLPVMVPVEGVMDIHGLLVKRKSAADQRACLQVYVPGTPPSAMQVPCGIDNAIVKYSFLTGLSAAASTIVPMDVTDLVVEPGELMVLRVESQPLELTFDPKDVTLIPNVVGQPLIAYTSVCLPQLTGEPCVRDHRQETLDQVPLDITNFGAFAEVPGVPEIKLPQQERRPPTPFVASRAGRLQVSPFSGNDGDSFVVRSDRSGLVKQTTCTLGCCPAGCGPGSGKSVSFDVEANESITFEVISDLGTPPPSIFVFYEDDLNLVPAPLIKRERLINPIPSPFMGGYRGWQATLWNEAIPFAPATLLEDYRVPTNLSEDRITEISRTAFWPSPSFGSSPFGSPAWFGAQSLAFATANSQNAAKLGSFTSPFTAGTQGGLFATNYARMSCTSSYSLGEGGVVPVGSRFGVPWDFSATYTTTNTTTDVVDLSGDGVADVIASKQSWLGALIDSNSSVRDTTLGDGFRRRTGFDYSVGLGGKGIKPRTTSGGRKLEETSETGGQAETSGSLKVGLAIGRSETTQDLEDLNGDGLPDIVSREGSKIFVRYNLGQKFGAKEQFANETDEPGVADLEIDTFENGEVGPFDTTSNALAHETTLTSYETASIGGSSITSLFAEVSVTFRETTSRTTRQLVDLNGDHLPDLLMKSDSGTCGAPIKVQFNLGGKFGSVQSWTSPCWQVQATPTDPVELVKLAVDWPAQVTHWLADLATSGHLLTGPDVLAATGTQGGFTIAANLSIPIIPEILEINAGRSGSRDIDTYELTLMDIDGDHDADHVLRRKNGSQASKVYIKRNGLTGKSNLLKAIHGPLGGTHGSTITLDYERTPNTVAMPQSRQVLTSITVDDGVPDYGLITSPNIVTTVAYGNGFYERREKEFFGFDTVKLTRGDGVTVQQTYNNTSYALHGHLRSESRRDTFGQMFLEHRVEYEARAITDANGDPIDGLASCKAAHPLLPGDACTPVFPVAIEDRVIRLEGGAASKTRFVEDKQHDRFGNVLVFVDHGDDAIDTDDVYARVAYRNDTGQRWLLGLPTSLEVRAGGDSGAILRSRGGQYDDRGRITQIDVSASADATATTFISYDDAGNVDTVTTPPNGSGDGQPQTYTTTYDPETETYPAVIKDGFSYESRADYDARFGIATHEVDINNAELTRHLDPFGRLISVVGPYDTEATPGVSIEYFEHESPPRAVTTLRPAKPTGGSAGPEIKTVTVLDGLGRSVETRRTSVVDGDVSTTTSGFVSRDVVGHVIRTWNPMHTAGIDTAFLQPVETLATEIGYDALDRQIFMRYPDLATETTTFDIAPDPDGRLLFVARNVDANGKPRETFVDLLDRTRAFVEHPAFPDAGTDSVTRYDYLATGELASIVDAEGNRTSLGYDRRGLRTTFENGDYGRIDEVYDLMGNRIALIEPNHRANNTQVTFRYDRNRLTTIDYPTKPDVTFVYGLAGQGQAGRLVEVHDESGMQLHTYGALGELTRTVRTVNAAQPSQPPLVFDLHFVTDSFGRTLSITYPDGETVTNSYDAAGNLAEVRGAGTNWSRAYVTQLQYDVFGNRTRAVYGNGVVTTATFDPKRVRLESLTTTLPNATEIQHLRYEYYPGSNPKKIVNELKALTGGSGTQPGTSTITMMYDGVDRLTAAHGDAALTAQKTTTYDQVFSYSPSYNITHKQRDHQITGGGPSQSPVGTNFSSDYLYSPGRPHLPTRIGDLEVTYDPSGNPTLRKQTGNQSQQNLVWDDDNRLVDFTGGGVQQHNTYDSGGLRVRRKSTQSETVFSSQYFDVENGTQGVKHVFAGSTRVASELTRFTSGQSPAPPDKQGIAYFFHQDHLQSTTVLTDETGAVHESLEYFVDGEAWIDRGPQKPVNGYLFSGKPFDPDTGFYDLGLRFYDPRTSLFLGPDPALKGSADVVGTPSSLSPVTYAALNPAGLQDPDGAEPQTPAGWRLYTYARLKLRDQVDVLGSGFNWDSSAANADWKHPDVAIAPIREAVAVQAETCATCPSSQFAGTLGDEAEYLAGYGDFVSMDLTKWARDKLGYGQSIDTNTTAYAVGQGVGLIGTVLGLAAGAYETFQGIRAWRASRAAKESARLLGNAVKPFKGGSLTEAGRALTKHPEVAGLTKSVFRQVLSTDAQINAAGERALQAILKGKRTVRTAGRFGKVIEYRDAAGYGARFYYSTGGFIGFIQP